jgi:flagellar hook assembly protein FlgD
MTATARISTVTLGVAVFAMLVVATVGAFFVTQRLKRSSPVVRGVSIPLYISPNGDGRKDSARIRFFLPKRDRVTVAIVDEDDDEVRRLADDRRMRRGRHSFVWRGRDDSDRVPPDGTYYLRVVLRAEGRATTAPRGIRLLTAPPVPKLEAVAPGRLRPGGRRRVAIRFSGPASPPPLFSVYRTSATRPPRLVDRFAGERNSHTGHWDATDERGRPVPPGTYAFAVTVQNKGLVSGSAPRRLPPEAAVAQPGTGVSVTGPQATGPLQPVRAGNVARIALDGPRGRVGYTLSRASGGRALERGSGPARALRVRIPRRARTGLYVVRTRGREGRTAVPIAVTGRGGGRVLVVVPAITWQGLNPVDDDANGFPNTLVSSSAVGTGRPLALGRLPEPYRRETAPLAEFLDERRLGYDLTTDLALARGSGPRLRGHSGVLFAGSALWLTEGLDAQLREYVEAGGRVASFGTDAFGRTVQVTATRLGDPSPRQDANVFGEQTEPAASEAAPLVVHGDSVGLFAGTDGYVGLFTRFEQQQGLVSGARVVAAAGRDPEHPAFVAYRLGEGTVVRVGTPQWARALAGDPEVARVTESAWDLLSR